MEEFRKCWTLNHSILTLRRYVVSQEAILRLRSPQTFLPVLLGGQFLEYSVLASDPVLGQQVGIILIELGVGMAVCGALLSIFHAFAARENRP